MGRKIFIIMILFLLFPLFLLFGGDGQDIKQTMEMQWNPAMLQNYNEYLNRSVSALMQTGKAPPYATELLSRLDFSRLNKDNQLRSYLLLSLPMSLTGQRTLDRGLEKKIIFLKTKKYPRHGINLLDKNWQPVINSNKNLIENADLLKNSIQLIALTIFEAKNLNASENDKLLRIIDRMVFYFGEWNNSNMNIKASSNLAQKLKKYCTSIETIIIDHNVDGALPPGFAIIGAELDYLKHFFLFRSDLW